MTISVLKAVFINFILCARLFGTSLELCVTTVEGKIPQDLKNYEPNKESQTGYLVASLQWA